jgi:hypothetical protein
MLKSPRWFGGVVALALLLAAGLDTAAAQYPRQIADAFTATTTGMTPAGVTLKMQVLEWTSDSARADVVATLVADDSAALAKLPTVGYVWPSGSPVGYTVKYAQRSPASDGGERITLVTDKPLGSYDYKKWSTTTAAAKPVNYCVIELYLNGAGTGVGNFSLGADVAIDEAAGTVSLASGGSGVPNLLAEVKRGPKT